MIPITPIGTRTRPTFMPFGRVHSLIVSPTGSGSLTISRIPSAISVIRSGVRRRRSAIASCSFRVPNASRSRSFADKMSSDFASRPSAIASKA